MYTNCLSTKYLNKINGMKNFTAVLVILLAYVASINATAQTQSTSTQTSEYYQGFRCNIMIGAYQNLVDQCIEAYVGHASDSVYEKCLKPLTSEFMGVDTAGCEYIAKSYCVKTCMNQSRTNRNSVLLFEYCRKICYPQSKS